MRNTPNLRAERYRIREGPMSSDESFGNCGAFLIPRLNETLCVIISDEGGWDHVSVSLPSRCPTWEEMNFTKELFFKDDEAVFQLHPPKKDWINNHDYCLHMWRPQHQEIPLPPGWMVGYRQNQE